MTEPGSPTDLSRPPLPDTIGAERVIAVLRGSVPHHVDAVVDVLVEEGFRAIELALTTPGALDCLPGLRSRLGDEVCLGAGTVTTIDSAAAAIDAGAAFLLSPTVCADVCTFAAREGVPFVSGAFTATEAMAGWGAGASAIKLFPANLLGPEAVPALRAPMPHLPLVPTGGIDADRAVEWLDHGCVAVGVGSPLLGDALEGGDLEALRRRARAFRQRLPSTRTQRAEAAGEGPGARQ